MTWDVGDDGACCHTASTRVVHFPRSSGSRIWTCQCSASDHQSHDSSSSERHSESHRCEGLGRPKEVFGREEDFQQWSKKTEASPGEVKESEMMLEWAAGQQTEITTTARLISSSCRRTRMWTEKYKTWSLRCSRCIQRSWLSLVVKRLTLSPTHGRTSRRRGEDCRNDMIRRQEEGNGAFRERLFLLDGAFFWDSKQIELWDMCRATRRSGRTRWTMRSSLPDLSHWCSRNWKSIRYSTRIACELFENARVEVVTYVEAKFGLRIRDSKPSDTGPRGHSDPMDVDPVNSLSSLARKRVTESA